MGVMSESEPALPPAPTLDEIRAAQRRVENHVIRTPTIEWSHETLARYLGRAQAFFKLETLQRTGTFKARGAVNNVLTHDLQGRGVVAVSAGNHAIAAAYAGKAAGESVKVAMIATGNPARRAAAEALGAEVFLAGGPAEAFELCHDIQKRDGRFLLHPFEGKRVTEATGGVGVELSEDARLLMYGWRLDAVVVAIGGGGLSSGVAAAVKQINPDCAVYGVEPVGAANMSRSFEAGAPATLDKVETIADSLGPPFSLPYSYSVCRKYIDDIVCVTDDEMAAGMMILFRDARLAVEPAAASVLAAAFGPLRERLKDKRVGFVICGSNIDRPGFSALLERGEHALANGVLAA